MPIALKFPSALRQRFPEGKEAYDLHNAQRIASIVAGPGAHVTVQPEGPRFVLGTANNWIMEVDEDEDLYVIDWDNSIGKPRLMRHYKRVIAHQLGLDSLNPHRTPTSELAGAVSVG